MYQHSVRVEADEQRMLGARQHHVHTARIREEADALAAR